MNELDEYAFREFAKGLNEQDRLFLIKEYRKIANKLKPLANGKWRKIHEK